ncbi:MAG: hypothetical protein H7268_03965 [Sandarakinorhabdus sp.]|nr:hypothetical protein [Sandarakinorhabdus sp.]
MNSDRIVRGLAAAATVAADAGVARATADVADRATRRFPEIAVEQAPGTIWLRGRGLLARAFGTRRRAADPRLADLTTGD